MENASKALLIAAAVLIVIILIAFGMRILNSTDGTLESAEKTGQDIAELTDKVTSELQTSFDKLGSSSSGTSTGGGTLGGGSSSVVPNEGEYKTASGEKINPGVIREPQEGDVYIYGDYEYRFGCFFNGDVWSKELQYEGYGWGVRVIKTDKTEYGEILCEIIGKPILFMTHTFSGCTYLENAPEIPLSIKEMSGAFYNCTKLENAPEIPDSVEIMSYAFEDCIKLKVAPDIPINVSNMFAAFRGCIGLYGTIKIDANPYEFTDCFKNTNIEDITGDCTIKQDLLATIK